MFERQLALPLFEVGFFAALSGCGQFGAAGGVVVLSWKSLWGVGKSGGGFSKGVARRAGFIAIGCAGAVVFVEIGCSALGSERVLSFWRWGR
jgi:hypothetical protein